MESSGKFERIFLKMLKEDMTAGAGGALGTGSSYSPPGNINSGDTYAPGDARNPTPLVQSKHVRVQQVRRRKRKEKKRTKRGFLRKMQKRKRKLIGVSVELIPFMVRRLLLTNLEQL